MGIFLAYTGARGYTLPDSELYLPEGWTNEPARAQRLQGLVRPGPARTGTKWAALHFHYRRQQATTLLCSTTDQFRARTWSVASCREMTSHCYGARLLSLGSIKFHTRS